MSFFFYRRSFRHHRFIAALNLGILVQINSLSISNILTNFISKYWEWKNQVGSWIRSVFYGRIRIRWMTARIRMPHWHTWFGGRSGFFNKLCALIKNCNFIILQFSSIGLLTFYPVKVSLPHKINGMLFQMHTNNMLTYPLIQILDFSFKRKPLHW